MWGSGIISPGKIMIGSLLLALLVAVFAVALPDTTSADTVTEGGAIYTLHESGGDCTATASWDGSTSEVTIKASVQKDDKTYYVTEVESFGGDIDEETPGANVTKVTFEDNQRLTNLPEGMFFFCEELSEVTFNEGLTELPMLAMTICPCLETVSLPSTLSVIGMAAFNGCASLTTIQFPENVVICDSAFANSGLTSITISDGTILDPDGADFFSGCEALENVIFNADVIPDNLFAYNTSLRTVSTSAVMIGPNAFKGCTALSTVNLGERLETIGANAFYGCISVTSLDLPESVETIAASAFRGCTGLTSIVLPEEISCGTELFRGCTSLSSVNLHGNTLVTAGMFQGCTSLGTIDLTNVTSIGSSAFQGCTSLTNINIPSTDTAIGTGAFRSCSSLNTVTISNGVVSIGQAVFFGTALEEVEIPASVSSIDFNLSNNQTVFPLTLERIAVNSDNTHYAAMDNILYSKDMGTIYYCPATIMGELTINSNVGDAAFFKSGLSKVTLSENVSSIGALAFKDATNLREVIMPQSIESIGGFCFAGSQLKAISLPAGVSLGTNALPSSIVYIAFPNDISGGAFTGSFDLWGGSVKMYDSDGNTQIAENDLENIRGQRFVWDGENGGRLYKMSDSQALFVTTVGDETSYKAVAIGSIPSLESPLAPEHKEFAGWYKDSDFTEAYDSTVAVNADTFVFAYFSTETHTVTYMVDGNVVGTVEVYEYGSDVSVRAKYDKVGYTVGEWESVNVTPIGGIFSIGSADIVFTATAVVNQYTITFDTAGGSAIAAITQDYNTSVTAPSAEPTKDGYRFVKWDSEIPASMPANDVTIKAVWAIVATVNENGKSVVTLDSDTNSFIPAAERKEITVEIRENTAVKVENASDLVGKTVVSKVEPVSNSTGVSGTAYEFTFTADGTQYNGKIQVTLPYTKEDGKEPVVYFWNGSESTKMNVVSSTDTSVTFETDHNSVYVVASETSTKDDGSSFLLYFGILMIAGICVSMLVGFNFYRKKA